MITASVVLYKTKKEELIKVLNSIYDSSMNIKLFIIDNSPTDELKNEFNDDVQYIKTKENIGYGKAHNIAIRAAISLGSIYHIILNPDIFFNHCVIEEIYNYMEKNIKVGLLMPKVVFPNEEMQYLCKLLPSPMNLFGRRFLPKRIIERQNDLFELRFTKYNRIMDVPYLSGCFMFIRTRVFNCVGMFDERFFMYCEDIDLSRRINDQYRTVYYPQVSIVHNHAKESFKSFKMLKMHIISAIKYFNKWSWFFDKKRRDVNKKILKTLNYYGE